MRVALHLLVSTAMAAASLLGGAPATAVGSVATPTSSLSVVAKKKPHKKVQHLGSLRVVITGSPRGRVHINGPKTHRSVTKTSVLRVRSGQYQVHAANLRLAGDTFVPNTHQWSVSVRKGATTQVNVTYVQAGASSPGSVDATAPPTGMLGEVFTLVNQVRSQPRQCGDRSMPAVDPVAYDDELGSSAQGHAADMNAQDYFEHDSLDGRTFADRIRDAGYTGSPAGENIAMGFQNAADVVQGWLDSPGHCVNVMDADFDEMGLGFASHADPRYSTPVTYWVQDFGYTDD